MPSRPIIYVNRITNLSDARYCAGMGVDMLGFVVTPGHPDYVNPVQYQEIMGWVSGPRRVAEIIDWESVDVDEVIAQYAPDLIHISITGNLTPEITSHPLIVALDIESWPLVQNNSNKIEYIVISEIPEDPEILTAVQGSPYPILMTVRDHVNTISEIQNKTNASGLMLQGSPELKPGLKDYDNLARILEALDI